LTTNVFFTEGKKKIAGIGIEDQLGDIRKRCHALALSHQRQEQRGKRSSLNGLSRRKEKPRNKIAQDLKGETAACDVKTSVKAPRRVFERCPWGKKKGIGGKESGLEVRRHKGEKTQNACFAELFSGKKKFGVPRTTGQASMSKCKNQGSQNWCASTLTKKEDGNKSKGGQPHALLTRGKKKLFSARPKVTRRAL